MDQDSSIQPQRSRKKWILIAAGTLLLIASAVLTIAIINRPKETTTQKSTQQETISKEYTIEPSGAAVIYAGNKVYDACNLISFKTIRENIGSYQSLLDTIGTGQRPVDPLVIEHGYIDRTIPAVLGKDSQPRERGTTIGGTSDEGIASFMKPFDSNCWYGQGEGISLGKGTTFVKTYVIQKPTPITGEILAYIDSMKPTASEKGVNVYVETKRDSGNFATVFAVNAAKDTVAIFKTGSEKIAESAAADLIAALSEAPKGPMAITYPKPWNTMPNPCTLITAEDFQRYTGKPATPIAEDSAYLTDVGDGHMKRTCARLEVERLNGGEISESKVEVRVAKSSEEAGNYIKGLKAREEDDITIEAISQAIPGADESYIKIKGYTKKRYALEMKIGAKLVSVTVLGEAGQEASTQAYTERMLPIAKQVATRINR